MAADNPVPAIIWPGSFSRWIMIMVMSSSPGSHVHCLLTLYCQELLRHNSSGLMAGRPLAMNPVMLLLGP